MVAAKPVVGGTAVNLPPGVISGDAARLIPVVADSSREVRATSVLLAALHSIPAFAKALLATVGHGTPAATVVLGSTEPRFQGKHAAPAGGPAGLLLLRRGSRAVWSALIEAKTGQARLDEGQLRRYVAVARANQIPAIIT